MISVYLLDDHPILVNTIELMLSSDSEITVAGKSNGYNSSTLTELQTLQPDVILLDISMPEYDSFELVPILKDKVPELKIVIYTMHSLNRYLNHFFNLGVDGYLIKSSELGNLFDAIKTVYKNGKYFPDTLINEISLAELHLEENQLQFTFFEKQIIEELKKAGIEMESKHQGVDNFRKYLEKNTKGCQYLFEKFRNALSPTE